MKSKIKIPLVIFSFLMVLGICSATIYYFNTRETNKLNNTVNNETVKKELSEDSEGNQNAILTESDSAIESENKEEITGDLKSDNQKEDNSDKSNNTIKTETPKNNGSSSKNNTTSKVEQNNQSSLNNSSTQSNSSDSTQIKEEQKIEETKTESNTNDKEEQENSTIYEIPDEDSKDKNNGSQDPEYLKIKDSCEFFTRAECQAALTDIQIKYLSSEHPMVSASCESYAYKGEIVGYRVLLTYGDGNYFYNN